MTDRVNQALGELASGGWDLETLPLKDFAEKFAELIVQECTNMLRAEMYRLDAIPGREVSAQTMETAQVLIKNHFGVER